MLKCFRYVLVLMNLLFWGLLPVYASEGVPKFHCPAPQTCVQLIHFNDVYEWKPYPDERTGTLSRFSTYLTQEKERFPNLAVVFGGDLLSPSGDSQLTHGLHMVEGLNALGVKVATLGNHEFDFGASHLQEALTLSKFPWLAANVTFLPNAKIKAQAVPPYMILEQAGKRILIFGLLTPETLQLNPVAPLVTIEDPIQSAQRLLPQWKKKEDPDAVIALTHLNIAEDRRLAQDVKGIDVILGGHDHHQLLQVIHGVPIIKVDSDARTVGHLQLNFNPSSPKRLGFKESSSTRLAEWHYEVTALTPEQFPRDFAFEQDVLQHTPMDLRGLDEQVTQLPVVWDTQQSAIRGVYSPTAQQIAEVLRRYLNVDVVLLNSGGIRGNRRFMPAPLTRRDALQILPFDNQTVIVSLRKPQLEAILEQGLSKTDSDPNWGGYLHFSGVIAVLNPSAVKGKRIHQLLDACTGKVLSDDQIFQVAINSYLAEGGNGFLQLKSMVDHQSVAPTRLKETQAITLGNALKAMTTTAWKEVLQQVPSLQNIVRPVGE
jgi:2',3'-cyclic-nucleotide 2'-phosphodiesterase (5'-nucleotidase family)